MKRHLNLIIAIMFICGAFAVNAGAQTFGQQRMRATIPFAFTVGHKVLPAGVYTITVVNPSSDRKALQIRSADGRSSAIVQTTGVRGDVADEAKLVFRRYGDQYFFAQVNVAGDPTGLAAGKTRAERATQRALARAAGRTVVAMVVK